MIHWETGKEKQMMMLESEYLPDIETVLKTTKGWFRYKRADIGFDVQSFFL